MNIVSLFDGISCAYVALNKANIIVKSYCSYEIDKHAIKISQKNHPMAIACGDVKNLVEKVECDILIGGSPCQDLSLMKRNRKGLEGNRSSLFWEYIRIKNLLQPKWFILENVASMADTDKKIITNAMGVEPIMFDASLVSAQKRKRYFWTNIPFTLPIDRNILLHDIVEDNIEEKYYINQTKEELGNKIKSQPYRIYSFNRKSVCLLANAGGLYTMPNNRLRRLTPIECERLQGLPDNYTHGISDRQRYKCIGNAFNCDVVSHILSFIH